MTDVAFTKHWWKKCLKDDAKLTTWLRKLQNTEIGGYLDYVNILKERGDEIDDRTKRIFQNIAEDEYRHSELLLDLFCDRNIRPDTKNENLSLYWTRMNELIVDVETYCAVNYLGESLAAFRFEVIAGMPETPSDIKYFLDRALPDEQFHRETLRRLCSDEVLHQVQQHHDVVFAILTGKRQ